MASQVNRARRPRPLVGTLLPAAHKVVTQTLSASHRCGTGALPASANVTSPRTAARTQPSSSHKIRRTVWRLSMAAQTSWSHDQRGEESHHHHQPHTNAPHPSRPCSHALALRVLNAVNGTHHQQLMLRHPHSIPTRARSVLFRQRVTPPK